MTRTGAKTASGLLAALLLQGPVVADESGSQQGLQMPEGLSMEDNKEESLADDDGDRVVHEYRIGGRLERVTVTRDRGLDETYVNKRNDTLWTAEENELGEVKNVREWTIGSW
jgi:hypothetical protein